ncbi:MAG TPA: 4Fe-4S dicluster domain-containing protein [Holophaga sp.]|jgi:heterodisulfide reductase subunit C|nr:4Fe-4S dicluster domain-containing protein [Holophaga sp.]
MSSGHHIVPGEATLIERVKALTGVQLSHCYQCGKCAAGCPVGDQMDLTSSQIFRLVQLGFPELEEKALRSEGIWLCLACETCSTRCPQEIEISKVMDALRSEALKRGLSHPKSRDILAFHRAFLGAVKLAGRLNEVGMVADYKRRTGHFLKDILVAPRMFLKGKLGLIPHRIKDRAGLRAIFRRTLSKNTSDRG